MTILDTKQLLITTLNDTLASAGLPNLSDKKTKTFVKINDMLKELNNKDMVRLVRDYGLLIPVLFMSDINIDYIKFLTNKDEVEADGFVRYVDTQLLLATDHDQKTMQEYFKHFKGLSVKSNNKDEMRCEYVSFILNYCINNNYKAYSESIRDLNAMVI